MLNLAFAGFFKIKNSNERRGRVYRLQAWAAGLFARCSLDVFCGPRPI